MAKILFIVNQHPNEAFATAVANETAKLLRKKGHIIIWKKFKAENTALGRILKTPEGKKRTLKRIRHRHNEKSHRTINQWIKSIKPDRTYNFHCTPSESPLWKPYEQAYSNIKISPADFIMTGHARTLIEIKAAYKEFPKEVQEKIQKIWPKTASLGYFHSSEYLRRTTSMQLSRKSGLHPENFAEKISKEIGMEIKQGSMNEIRSQVPKARPKSWLERTKKAKKARETAKTTTARKRRL